MRQRPGYGIELCVTNPLLRSWLGREDGLPNGFSVELCKQAWDLLAKKLSNSWIVGLSTAPLHYSYGGVNSPCSVEYLGIPSKMGNPGGESLLITLESSGLPMPVPPFMHLSQSLLGGSVQS